MKYIVLLQWPNIRSVISNQFWAATFFKTTALSHESQGERRGIYCESRRAWSAGDYGYIV